MVVIWRKLDLRQEMVGFPEGKQSECVMENLREEIWFSLQESESRSINKRRLKQYVFISTFRTQGVIEKYFLRNA